MRTSPRAARTLQQFGTFLLKGRLVKQQAAPYCVRWVRRFLMRPASNDPLPDQVCRFCEDLERDGCHDWQVRQAGQALRIYWVNFRQTTEWQQQPAPGVTGNQSQTDPLAALEELRRRIRTRHDAYRTEVSYVDWARRFVEYLAERQAAPHPIVRSEGVRLSHTSGGPAAHLVQHTEPSVLRHPSPLPRSAIGRKIQDGLVVRCPRHCDRNRAQANGGRLAGCRAPRSEQRGGIAPPIRNGPPLSWSGPSRPKPKA